MGAMTPPPCMAQLPRRGGPGAGKPWGQAVGRQVALMGWRWSRPAANFHSVPILSNLALHPSAGSEG